MIKLVDRSEVASIDKSLESTESVLITKRQWERIKAEMQAKVDNESRLAFTAQLGEIDFQDNKLVFEVDAMEGLQFTAGNYQIRKVDPPSTGNKESA